MRNPPRDFACLQTAHAHARAHKAREGFLPSAIFDKTPEGVLPGEKVPIFARPPHRGASAHARPHERHSDPMDAAGPGHLFA